MKRFLFYKILLLALVAVWTDTGWTAQRSWRGGNTADSMKVNSTRGTTDALKDNGYGADTAFVVDYAFGMILVDSQHYRALLQPAYDGRDAGYTVKDSAKLHIFFNHGNPSAAGETTKICLYPLKEAWGEGNDVASATGAGESDYIDSKEGTSTWSTAGPKQDGTDVGSTPLDTLVLAGAQTMGTEYVFTIPGSSYNDVVDYGVVLVPLYKTDNGTTLAYFCSDDNGTAAQRPYFEFWESQGSACPSATLISPANSDTITVSTATLIFSVDVNPADDTCEVLVHGGRNDATPNDTVFIDTVTADYTDTVSWSGLGNDSTYYWDVMVTDSDCDSTTAAQHFHTNISTSTIIGAVKLGATRVGPGL